MSQRHDYARTSFMAPDWLPQAPVATNHEAPMAKPGRRGPRGFRQAIEPSHWLWLPSGLIACHWLRSGRRIFRASTCGYRRSKLWLHSGLGALSARISNGGLIRRVPQVQ